MARKKDRTPVTASITDLAHDGRGVARIEDKAVFIDGALAGEEVTFVYTARRRSHDEGEVVEILRPSPQRVEPRCPHFGVCGGCSLQHLAPRAQIQAKQRVLLENLRRIGKVEPESVLEPLTGPAWGYRGKARLGVKYVAKKGRVLVGFRERAKPYVAELEHCDVLDPSVGGRLPQLAEAIGGMDAYNRIPQVEVAVAEEGTALVFRNLEPLSDADAERLRRFGDEHGFIIYLQPKGPDTVAPLPGVEVAGLHYRLPEYDVTLRFRPTDFTQVNAAINQAMVERALGLLDLQPGERLLELFCGLGNFSLPAARGGARVTGVEGEQGLVERARENAECNGLDNADFHVADLAEPDPAAPWLRGGYDKVLLDPPRSGAREALPAIAAAGPSRVVYVSCNPATLARDAGVLAEDYGYRLVGAGVMDMFPHTAHVESIALFEAG